MALSEIKSLYLILALGLLSFEAGCIPLGARRGLIDNDETVFDVTTFGAKPDGVYDSTLELIKAWNAACKSAGPAKLVFPPGDFVCGEVVFQGPCTAPITVEIQGNLISTTDLSVFTQGTWISVEYVNGITVTGGGTLDGKGDQVWQYSPKEGGGDALLPISFIFSKVQNGAITNLKVLNSKGFHSKVTFCENITVSNLEITAPGDSPNTDGLHISSSLNVNVTNLVIATGDDCISIGDGNTNIAVSNITCGPGHGISVGSLGKRPTEKDVKGVTVTNCTFTNTTNGARIKTYHDSPAIVASGIIYEDIVMNQVSNPIIIDQHYASRKTPKPSRVQISDVHFRNIRGTTNSPVVVTLNCSETVPCQGIELADIDFAPIPGKPPLSSVCFNAKPTVQGVQNIAVEGCQ